MNICCKIIARLETIIVIFRSNFRNVIVFALYNLPSEQFVANYVVFLFLIVCEMVEILAYLWR